MTSTPKAVFAKDMPQRLGMKRYEPVWYKMRKIRRAIGRANTSVQLTGTVELDDGYFTAHRAPEPGDDLFNRGLGSARKHPMLVTIEYREVAKRKSAGRLRMVHLSNLKGTTHFDRANRLLRPNAVVITDSNPAHKAIAPHVKADRGQKSTPNEACNALPRVHAAKSNAQRLFLEIFHYLSSVWHQNYLDEFCFKFNGRSDGESCVLQLFETVATCRLYPSG